LLDHAIGIETAVRAEKGMKICWKDNGRPKWSSDVAVRDRYENGINFLIYSPGFTTVVEDV
jgi:hypothetical protein